MADQKMSPENDHKLDEMLDAMLSAYSAAEPRPGLETRILANVKEQELKSTARWGFRWTWAVAALATAALVVMVIYVSRLQTHPVEPQIATHPQPARSAHAKMAQKTLSLPQVTASNPSRHGGNGTRAARSAAIAIGE